MLDHVKSLVIITELIHVTVQCTRHGTKLNADLIIPLLAWTARTPSVESECVCESLVMFAGNVHCHISRYQAIFGLRTVNGQLVGAFVVIRMPCILAISDFKTCKTEKHK